MKLFEILKSKWPATMTAKELAEFAYDDQIDSERVNSYMEKSPESAPPLICSHDGGIIDGHHRYLAAKARGDITAQAYILS